MSSIYDPSFKDIIQNSIENAAFDNISIRSFETERNIYDFIFSLDSDDTEYMKQRQACQDLITQENMHTSDFVKEDNSIQSSQSTESVSYDNLEFIQNIDILHEKSDQQYDSSSDMSISSGSSFSSTHYTDEDELYLKEEEESVQSVTSHDSLGFLDEKEIFKCFKGDILDNTEHEKWENNLHKEVDNESNIDIIATYNIQNRYDHMLAAEMMMQQNFTFLALQEPHASHHRNKQNWADFKRKELASARITAYETDLQVILYDNWKWGGKEISKFQSFQNGRVAAIAFGFKNNQKLGIISIYGITESSTSDEASRREIVNIRNSTTFLVKKIMGQWNHNHPGIGIMIMGDLQETMTVGDSDNVGNFRKPMFKNGILQNTSASHTSIARDHVGEHPYVTRFGTAGGRGIDHILVPTSPKTRDWFIEGTIDNSHSAKFFPSDHALLACTFARRAKNNKVFGSEMDAYEYKKLFQIKLKRTGPQNDDLVLDESQFKGSRLFSKQQKLLEKVHELTANDSDESNHYLCDIEERIKKLNAELWKAGKRQQVDGNSNKLIKITDKQALRLSYITKSFNENVRAIMTALKLDKKRDTIGQGGVVRKSLHKGKGFRNFQNLPIPTKLRYLGKSIRHNLRKLQNLKTKLSKWKTFSEIQKGDSTFCFDFDMLHKILDSNALVEEAGRVRREYLEELEERMNHMSAIDHFESNYKICKKSDGSASLEKDENYMRKDNTLNLDANIIKLINGWLAEEKCNQPFNSKKDHDHFEFLIKDNMSKWKNHILHWDDFSINTEDEATRGNMVEDLEKSERILENMLNNVVSASCEYKIQTLNYFICTNKISNFTNKVLPKGRDAPVPHSSIWDPTIKNFRKCISEDEEMIATGLHHNHWMSPSAAEESCAFAEIVHEGNLGPRGIKLKPERVVTGKDISTLIKNGDKLPNGIKNSFIAAHGDHTAQLFREPKKDRKEFYYPFFLQHENGSIHMESMLKESFMKAVSGIPGKARHGGFQMAVLGRFGKRWQGVLFQLLKLMLIMRYIPPDLKKISRFPIPKPGRVGEYRPISLCHDMYCFMNGIITTITSKGIEDAKILHEGLTSYRPGMGCVTLVGVEQAFREDCIQSGIPSTQIDEDEEKFFDRIPLEIILASMRVCGFPIQGFIEFKANCMDSKAVEIITNKGNARATFSCGLEQGNPNSPTIANLVILMKHRIWNLLCEELLAKEGKKAEKYHSYSFHVVDKQDGELIIKMMGYCDDNSRFLSAIKECDLIWLTKKFLKLTGDLSMVTKIGRKGSKSEVHFFNLSATTASKLCEIETVAWSFADDLPTKEYVPFKLCLQKKEETILKIWIEDNDELSEDDKAKWRSRINPEEHKHLGLTSTLKGNAEGTRSGVIKKVKERIVAVNSQKLSDQAQRLCNNMLCTSIPTYAPIQSNHSTVQLHDCDALVAQCLRRKRGLTKSDAMHKFWISEELGGFGFKSFLEEDLISVARELEVVLNSNEIDSKAIRARLEAFNREPKGQYKNHVRDAVQKLGKYGFYLRDRNNELLNYVLGNLAKERKYAPVGNAAFRDGNRASIGQGKQHLLTLSMGGILSEIILNIIGGKSMEDIKAIHPGRLPVSYNKLKSLINQAKVQRFRESTQLFNFWEWSHTEKQPKIPTSLDQWKLVNIGEIIKKEFPHTYLELTSKELSELCYNKMKINFENNLYSGRDNKSEHSTAIRKILDSESPLIIATDGSHAIDGRRRKCTAAFVACKLNIAENESICDNMWEDRAMEPMIARIMVIPQRLGTEPSDISHGEGMAFWLQEASFDRNIPRGVISDSAAVRNCVINVRENASKKMGREFIRKDSAGISKYVIGAFRKAYRDNLDGIKKHQEEKRDNSNQVEITKNKIWSKSLYLRLSIFIQQSEKWTTQDNNTVNDEKATVWPRKYWDAHNYRPIIKINSHQLDPSGSNIKSPPRYENLVPKLAPLNANHWADICAGMPREQSATSKLSDESIDQPRLSQRFYFTWGGMTLDKDVASRFRKIFMTEKMKRLRSKPTQGMLWRLMNSMHTPWSTLSKHKGWKRSLSGFSNTHSRAVYKSSIYRNGNWLSHFLTPLDEVKDTEKINMSIKCNWCNGHQNTKTCGRYGHRIKGNRTHHMYFCQHDRIQRFRRRMEGLIEGKLHKLIHTIMEADGVSGATTFLHQINEALIHLDATNTGRLERPPATEQYVRPIANWMERLNINSIMDGIKDEKLEYQHIFGMKPIASEDGLADCYIGASEAMLFGLVPQRVQEVIETTSRFRHCMDLPVEARTVLSKQLLHQWEGIQQLMIAKVGGLHKILGVICKEKEKEWKTTFKDKLLIESFQTIKREKRNAPSGTQKEEAEEEATRRRKKARVDAGCTQKRCYGISCRHQMESMGIRRQLPNQIPLGKRQCQRCDKKQAAIKVGAKNLHVLAKEMEPGQRDQAIHLIKQESLTSPNYTSLMNLLNNKTDAEVSNKAKFNSKKRKISDKDKSVCRVIIQEIQREPKHDNSAQEILTKCAINLDGKLSRNRGIMQTDVGYERSLLQQAQNTKMNIERVKKEREEIEIIDIDSSQSQDDRNDSDSKEDPEPKRIYNDNKKILMMTKWQLFSGNDLDQDIKISRNLAGGNMFLADQDASFLIQSYKLTDEWGRFGRMFRSAYVRNNKPPGMYLIPMFWGSSGGGHWSTIVIWRRGRRNKGYHLDSIGKSNNIGSVFDKIRSAFTGKRDRFSWIQTECRPQEEMECGFRTVEAIRTICEGRNNGDDEELCIEKAKKVGVVSGEYCSLSLRRKVAHRLTEQERASNIRAGKNGK